jgi:pyruvate-formate lyase-activating enzyme
MPKKILHFLKSREYYERQYVDNERSLHDIAAELNSYPNRIKRELEAYHIHVRDKSEAQKVALKTGRAKPPKSKTKSNNNDNQE